MCKASVEIPESEDTDDFEQYAKKYLKTLIAG
jgi:hypothetical protein